MKWKKPSQQTVAATHSDLPDECWECIFRFLVIDDLDSVSLVSKRFLSVSDRLRFSIHVESETLPILGRLLERFTNLKLLNLYPSNIINHDLNNLFCNISHFPLNKLTSLDICYLPSFPSNGFRVFSQKITTLTSLTFFYSFLSNNDLSLIAECFPLLEKLNIFQPFARVPFSRVNHINFIEGMYSLLSKCQCIQHLDLSHAYFLNDQHVAEFCLFLAGLKSIHLGSCCDLTESALCSLVRNCPSLSEIKMEDTCIGKESAVSSNILRDFVGVSSQLKSLSLARCGHLKDENIILFSSIFPNLELLDLSGCDQISEGICQVLRRCCKITQLNLFGCSRVKLLGINFVVPKLEVLDLSYTKVDDETLYVISKNCPGLLELLLKGCENITPEGVKHVVENCTQLRKVYLGGFHISNEIRELFSRRGCLLFKYFSADF